MTTVKKIKTTASVFELPQRLCPSVCGVRASSEGVVYRRLGEVKLELEFKRYETCEEKIREMYRPKGLLAYTTAAKEYVRVL